MSIVSSVISGESLQGDGRSYVTEQHTDSDGNVYTFESLLSADVDRAALLAARAAILNAQLSAKAEIAAAIAGTGLPLTKLEFLSRFTVAERIAIRSSTDPVVADFMSMLDMAQNIQTTHPDTVAGLGYLVSVGLLTAARAAVIGA